MHPKAKNYLLILLAASTAASAYLAWQQSQRLNALQAQLLKSASVAIAPITRQKHAEPPLPRDEDSAQPTQTVGEKPHSKAGEPGKPKQSPNGGRPDFASLMTNPDFAKAISLQQRAGLDERYTDLFKMLQLSPTDLEKFKSLLVERQTARMDVVASAREQGLNPKGNREDLQKLTLDAQAEVDASIKAALGDSDFNRYQNYDATLPQRNQVSQLDQRLSYSGTPLNRNQIEFLVSAITPPATIANAAAQSRADAHRSDGNRNTVSITDAVIQQAQSVLTVEQLAALKQIQSEQQARQTIRDMMRPPTNSGSSTPSK